MNFGRHSDGATLLLVLATVAALAVVPDWPHRHLANPSYWAVGGFVVLTVRLLSRSRRSWEPGGAARLVVIAFLALVPIVYVADWFRFGGSGPELGLQLAGVALWLWAALAARTSDTVLWVACIAHALWDAIHFGRVSFIPEWYAAACLAADMGLGAFVLLELRESVGSVGERSA